MIGDTITEKNISVMPIVTSEEGEAERKMLLLLMSKSLWSGLCGCLIAPIGKCRNRGTSADLVQRLMPHVLIYLGRDTGEALAFQMV
jgi:hypothetical protein